MKKYGVFVTVIAFVALFSIGTVFYNSQKDQAVPKTSPTPSPTLSNEQKLTSPTQAVEPVRTEKKAKDITLKTTDGRTISLADYAGKVPVVINFWASWCPPCRDEMIYFDKYAKLHSEDKLVFLMINLTDGQRETASKATKYLSDSGFNFRNVLLDTKSKAAMDYNISTIPQTFFVDKDGYIINSHTGSIQESILKKYLENLTN